MPICFCRIHTMQMHAKRKNRSGPVNKIVVRRFNPSAAGINPQNSKAGLLTYPFPTPSRPKSVAKIVENTLRCNGTQDLQQRGLFGICTRFPFNRRDERHRTEPLHCKNIYFSENVQKSQQIFRHFFSLSFYPPYRRIP